MCLYRLKVRLGHYFDHGVSCWSRRSVTTDHVNHKQLRIVRISDANCAIVTKVEAAVRLKHKA